MSPGRRGDGTQHDRGAAAVEFALLLPLLLLILFGLIDFGRALNAQITLTQAAREGARLASLGYTNAAVQDRTIVAATGLGLTASDVTVVDQPNSLYACPSGTSAPSLGAENGVVKVSYSFSFVTPVGAIMGFFGGSGFGSPITLAAQGVMPCET